MNDISATHSKSYINCVSEFDSDHSPLKSTFNAENFICRSPAILAQFTLEMCITAQNHQKIH